MLSLQKPSIALLATTALLAAPGTALAQSAGDQQYADPLADTPRQNDSGGGNQGNSGGQGNSGSQGNSGAGSGSGTQGSTGTGSGTAGSSQSQATPSQQQGTTAQTLPRTGSDAALPLAAGAILLGSGLLVRLGVSARRDPA